ncbi:MAG: hypothetical protein G01um101466_92 [Parcubacteria group bacterium Gr01-1014_66]|nr:MAG: hypothetical protein G01um101466_92 [Parcubacteria group bacterium Gr01-1014_66]
MTRKFIIGIGGIMTAIALSPLFAAFEAHVINVTAKIENALNVHPEALEFGTVFPQEHLDSSFFISFSQSFSAQDQRRVSTVRYLLKQKPKPRPDKIDSLGGLEKARDWCHTNAPADVGDVNDPYYQNCYPNICPYLSKHPDNNPSTGANANNDIGLPPFHDPEKEFARGKMVKFKNGNTINNDPADMWTVDLAVPCFRGMCAQDWEKFVTDLNPNADPDKYPLDPRLEHQTFGCDIWVEVTKVF